MLSVMLHGALFATVPRCEPPDVSRRPDAPASIEVTRRATLFGMPEVVAAPHPVQTALLDPGRGQPVTGNASPPGAPNEGGDAADDGEVVDGSSTDLQDPEPTDPAAPPDPTPEDPDPTELPVRTDLPKPPSPARPDRDVPPPERLEWVQTLVNGATPNTPTRIGSHTRSGPDQATRGPSGAVGEAAQSLGTVATGTDGAPTPRAQPEPTVPELTPTPAEPPAEADEAPAVVEADALADANAEAEADAALSPPEAALALADTPATPADPTRGSSSRPDRAASEAQGVEGVQREAVADGLLPTAVDPLAAASASEAQAAREPSDVPTATTPPIEAPADAAEAAAEAARAASPPSTTTQRSASSASAQWTSEALPDVLIQATRRGALPAGSAGGAGGDASPSGPHFARVGPVTYAGAVSTPLGVYLDEVERVVSARWSSAELPLVERVLGRGGEVVLEFRVRRNGEVRDLKITRPSGLGMLDAAALGSIPDRLPPIPRELGLRSYTHRLTLTWSPGRVR